MPAPLDPKVIRAALARIPAEFRDGGQFVSDELTAIAGRSVVVKVESVNPIGSFKGRGAWLAVRDLVDRGVASPERGIVVASTGNFGQAIAYAGRAAGAGTLAVELTDAINRGELPAVETAYIPVGNGALIAGVGAWMRHAAPTTRVVGVQSEAAPSMTLSWRAGRLIETETADTRAGGISTRVPVPGALEMMNGVVDDMVLVSERALEQAQVVLQHALGVTAELASAASWAGFLAAPPPTDGAILIVVTGSNLEPG